MYSIKVLVVVSGDRDSGYMFSILVMYVCSYTGDIRASTDCSCHANSRILNGSKQNKRVRPLHTYK